MSRFGKQFDEALDRHITGNYGDDQFSEEEIEEQEKVIASHPTSKEVGIRSKRTL